MIFQNSAKFALVGLSAIALLGMPESVQAIGDCGLNEGDLFTGPTWVSNCPPGVDVFPQSWAKIIVDIPELSPIPFAVKLKGPATITRQAGSNGVILTTISEMLTGKVHLTQIPGIGKIKLTGEGTGAITDTDSHPITGEPRVPNDGFADSFFNVNTTIDVNTSSGPLTLTSAAPVTVIGDRSLIGVPPDIIIPPGPDNMPLLPECFAPAGTTLPEGTSLAIPPIAIAYCGNTPVNLLDENGVVRGQIRAEVHTVHPRIAAVPEPSSVMATVVGLGAILKLKRKQKQDS